MGAGQVATLLIVITLISANSSDDSFTEQDLVVPEHTPVTGLVEDQAENIFQDIGQSAKDVGQDIGQYAEDVVRKVEGRSPRHESIPLKFQVWDSTPAPEAEIIKGRHSIAVCLSGGGSRAYSAAVGMLRGLTSGGYMEKAAYVGSISGGTWAASTYTFQNKYTDTELLGAVVQPGSLSLPNLKGTDSDYAMADPPTKFGMGSIAKSFLAPAFVLKRQWNMAWADAVKDGYLAPFGLGDQYFTWTDADVIRIKNDNPSLQGAQFVTARAGRPYLIMGGTMMGSAIAAPFRPAEQNYHVFEMGGMASGVNIPSQPMTYDNADTGHTSTVQVGGFAENIGIGADVAPNQSGQTVGASSTTEPMTLAWAVGTSSSFLAQASATFFAGMPSWLQKLLAKQTNYEGIGSKSINPMMPYTSPTKPDAQPTKTLFMDGGNMENTGILPMLTRKVKRIVSLVSTSVPLATKAEWDPTDSSCTEANNYNYSEEKFPDDLASLFGILALNPSYTMSNYGMNAVFPKSAFPTFIAGLQKAQTAGKFPATTIKLKTIANERFGIVAGTEVEFTVLLLAKADEFEKALPEDTQKEINKGRTTVCKNTGLFCGDFKNFPNYDTVGQIQLSKVQTKLLAAFVQWGVDSNKALLDGTGEKSL